MDARAVGFLEVMIAVAIIGVLSFLIYLVAQHGQRRQAAGAGEAAPGPGPRWYEFILATIVLAIVAAVLFWQLFPPTLDAPAGADWRGGTRSLVFFAVMAAVGILALLVFLVAALARGQRTARAASEAATVTAEAEAGRQSPAALRGLALLILALAFLVLNWVYVGKALQYELMRYLVYPAAGALVLVLLWDKATRSWTQGGGAETLREWLFCNSLVFLLVLGYLNLLQWADAAKYAALFWDLLAIVLLLATFWAVDRTAAHIRFLVAYGFLVLLPILLLIWRFVHEVEAAAELSWWSTIWPFLILAVIFFVLEIIALLAGAGRQLLPTIKDVLFVVLYAVLLIVAIPPAPA